MVEQLARSAKNTSRKRKTATFIFNIQNSGNSTLSHTIDSHNNSSVTDNSSGHIWNEQVNHPGCVLPDADCMMFETGDNAEHTREAPSIHPESVPTNVTPPASTQAQSQQSPQESESPIACTYPPSHRVVYSWVWEPDYFWDGFRSFLYGLAPKLRPFVMPVYPHWVSVWEGHWWF
ncbi:hypothetical protein HGRIS_011821 [Hohenbuehelia grisea]|uniref:Uncharacterized protein n=1 Tax=Hohenbuehelia grisea TaxID=104357 RepID=A0ABR3JX95_9AGAR